MSKRYLDRLEARALLLAIGECRRACTRAQGKMPVPDTTYDAVSILIAAIDEVARARVREAISLTVSVLRR